MKKITQLKVCDWSLLVLTILVLASSIHLEATNCRGIVWVWLHIVAGLAFMAGIVWHLYLHFQWRMWIRRLRTQKSPVTRWLAVFGALTLITAIVALCHWADTGIHSSIGGVHGKLGFIFVALAIGHTVKRIRFFRKTKR